MECDICEGAGHRTISDLEGNETEVDCIACSGGMRM